MTTRASMVRRFAYWLAFLAVTVYSVPCMGQEAADVLEHARPAVVTITTSDSKAGESSQGSGFIIRENGVVVTAFHVIADALSVKVKLADGHTYTAVLLDKNKARDYALLKIDESGLPTLSTGDPAKLRQGDKVYTLGSPAGLEQTASEGIVSAIRQDPDKGTLIQTTAPISAGSSGGPLLNVRGEVVGITLFKLKDGQALDFAVAIDQVDLSAIVTVKEGAVLPGALFESGMAEVALADADLKAESEHSKMKDSDGAAIARKDEVEHIQKAIVLFKQAIAEKPDWADVLYRLGKCYDRLDWRSIENFENALNYYQRCTEVQPDNANAWYELGRKFFPDWGSAANAYKRATVLEKNLDPGVRRDAYVMLAACLDALHDYSGAAQAHEQAALRSGQPMSYPSASDEFFSAGIDYDMLRRHDKALVQFEQGIALHKEPKDLGRAWFELGLRLFGDFADYYGGYRDVLEFDQPTIAIRNIQLAYAINAFRNARNLTPEITDGNGKSAVVRIAEAQTELEHWRDAIRTYQTAIRDKPDDIWGYIGLADVYYLMGGRDHLIYYNFVQSFHPTNPSRSEASSLYRKGKNVLLMALQINPHRFDSITDLQKRTSIAYAYRQFGSELDKYANLHKESAQAYRFAIIMTGATSDTSEDRMSVANECLLAGDRAGALEQYEVLKKLDPDKAKDLYKRINRR